MRTLLTERLRVAGSAFATPVEWAEMLRELSGALRVLASHVWGAAADHFGHVATSCTDGSV